MIAAKRYRAVDLFCGAGGTTEGARQSESVQVDLAINHWRPAISSHSANHPDVRHICASIDHVDPRDFTGMKLDVLVASPECIFHSNARGGAPIDDQRRATAWCVPRWAEALNPKWIVVENVREFVDWGPIGADRKPLKSKKGEIFQAWAQSLRALNYHVEWKLLNAADFGGATKRIRLFIVARRGRSSAAIPWPTPTHAKESWAPASSIIDWNKECPSIFGRKRPLADKTLRRIELGLRKFAGPFVANLRRNCPATGVDAPINTITAGASHHALCLPFQFKAMGRNPGQCKSINEPLPTIVAARENHALIAPFIVGAGGSGYAGKPRDVQRPLNTITCENHAALATPFVVNYHGGEDSGNRHSSIDSPLPVIDTNPRHALVQPYLIDVNHGDADRSPGGRVHSVNAPLITVTTKRSQGFVQPFLVDTNWGENRAGRNRVHDMADPLTTITTQPGQSLVFPFVTEFYGTGGARGVDEPLSTATTKHRHGLTLSIGSDGAFSLEGYFAELRSQYGKSAAMLSLLATMEELGVWDIGFRMLDIDELALAQGFPAGYQLFGSKAEQIKQIGNSVHTLVAKALFNAIGAAA
jgi:DNA (cytosine-5)-methyltransferase 1